MKKLSSIKLNDVQLLSKTAQCFLLGGEKKIESDSDSELAEAMVTSQHN